MKTPQQKFYKVLSYVLGYPNARFFDGISEAQEWIKGIPPKEARDLLIQGFEQFALWDLIELQKHYVMTFDFKESTALHLTVHEHGDSRERGEALLKLKGMLWNAGYVELDGEIPDYIPLLLEFLAEGTIDTISVEIEQRLAFAITKIRKALDPESPYAFVFSAAGHILPVTEKLSDIQSDELDSNADIDEIPYPLYYEY